MKTPDHTELEYVSVGARLRGDSLSAAGADQTTSGNLGGTSR